MSTVIGIIGGSGLYALDPQAPVTATELVSPFSDEPVAVYRQQVAGREVIFLPRHGVAHRLPPHRINYRANIDALKNCGVTAILAVNVVGGIAPDMPPGTLVIPDQVIDYTWGRQHTFFDELQDASNHVDFTFPYDPGLGAALASAAATAGQTVVLGGVYGCTQGPRLESAAEIARLQGDGCDMVGMTGMPEAALAREAQIPYACLALVVNPAAGLGTGEIDFAEISTTLASGMTRIRSVLQAVLATLP